MHVGISPESRCRPSQEDQVVKHEGKTFDETITRWLPLFFPPAQRKQAPADTVLVTSTILLKMEDSNMGDLQSFGGPSWTTLRSGLCCVCYERALVTILALFVLLELS